MTIKVKIIDYCLFYIIIYFFNHFGSFATTMIVSPALNLFLFEKFMMIHPAEHPGAGGWVLSPVLQIPHP